MGASDAIVYFELAYEQMLKVGRYRAGSWHGNQRYLAPGEVLIKSFRRHPIVLVKPLGVWLLSLVGVGLASLLLTQGLPVPFIDLVVRWLALLLTAFTAVKYIRWRMDRYLITNRRVLLIEGLFSLKVSAVALARITGTSFSRSFLGRILGYGNLSLGSADPLGLARLEHVAHPQGIYRLITSLLLGDGPSGGSRPVPGLSRGEEITGPLPPVIT